VFRAEVETCVARGERWLPLEAREVPDIGVLVDTYLDHRTHRLRASTLRRCREHLDLFLRFLRSRRAEGGLPATLLSRPLIEDFYLWLLKPATSLRGRARSKDTARKVVEVAQLMWRWAEDSDRWPGRVPRPKRIEMGRSLPPPPSAPTWAEMDACIAAVKTPWIACLLTFLRFTGLRVGETMLLRWEDLDLERGLLTIEPGISKTGRGRVIPVSAHLVEALSGWPRVSSCVIPSPPGSRDRARQPRAQEVARAWREAGVPERVWSRAPHHAFRKGLKSGLLRAGAPPDAVDYLQGHVIAGSRGRYATRCAASDGGV